MSGFEVVGVLLGALPLAISFFEHYSDGLSLLADIWNVGHEIDAFVKSLKVQELIFRTTVVEFLGPVSSQQELKNLLNDRQGDAWKAPSLYKNLRSHYSGSYETYLILLERISGTVKELHAVAADLGLQTGKEVSGQSNSSCEHLNVSSSTVLSEGNNRLSQPFGPGITHGLARAKFVLLRKARSGLLSRLSNDIGQFTELHHSDVKVTRNARKWDIGGRFRQRRDEASSMYNVLAHDWRCDCTCVHDVYLQLSILDTRVLDNGPKEQYLVFSCPTKSNNANTAFEFCQRTTLTVTEVQKNIASTNVAPTPKTHVENNRTTKTSSLKKLTRIVSRENKERSSSAATVRFAQVPSPGSLRVDPTGRIGLLCDTLHRPSPASQHHLGYLLDESGQRHVHFHKISEPAELARASMQSLLTSRSSAMNAALVDSPGVEATEISPGSASIPPAPSRGSKARRSFRLGETFGIAAVLSSSLLQMHTTPWITERWNGTEIQFLHPMDQQPASSCMYLHRQYHSPISCPPASRQEKQHDTTETKENRDEIFSLGIMLLELLYEAPFSEQEALFADGGDADCYSRQIAAASWLEDIPRNSDFHLLKYDKIVQYCLECNFGVGFGSVNTCLWDGDFREAMYSHVVEPLERLAKVASSR